MDNPLFGVIGNATLYLSPLPDIVRIHKKKSAEELHPYHYIYIAGILSCLMSAEIYDPFGSMLFTVNSIGFLLYFFYFITFLINSPDKQIARVLHILTLVIVAFAATTFTTLYYTQNPSTIAKVADILRILSTVGLHASPLTVVFDVFKTKSVDTLPFWVGLAGFVKGCFWTAYGMTSADVCLSVGNGIGALFSAYQLLLHVVYSVDFKLGDTDIVGNSDDREKTPLMIEMV